MRNIFNLIDPNFIRNPNNSFRDKLLNYLFRDFLIKKYGKYIIIGGVIIALTSSLISGVIVWALLRKD